MDKAFNTLEINKILEEVKKFIKTKIGLIYFNNIKTFNDIKKIRYEYLKLDEMKKIIKEGGELPINSDLDVQTLFIDAKKGSYLDEISLNAIKNELLMIKNLLIYFSKLKIEHPNIKNIYSRFKIDYELINLIESNIDNENKVKDTASTNLSKIRNRLKSIDKDIRNKISELSIAYKNYMVTDNYVFRNGTYALPINNTYKSYVPGIVIDISDSGMTTFIEPTQILTIENEKRILEINEKEEVNKILKDLSLTCFKKENELLTNNKTLGTIDLLNAKAHYALKLNATIPNVTNKKEIALYQARHPLLNQDIVVPNDFILNEETPLMLISGPNAGGKTIALKTIATLSYMVKFCLAIPASEGSKVGLFDKIFVDVGDDQSIENNLSTFSSQINSLSVILKSISSRDLVCFDELCNGTDPKEGDALAVAIAKFLLSKKCLSVITSHYPLLKKYGLSNSKIINASFIFDKDKLEPTFKMVLGNSGKSYGFLIARKFGLPIEIVNEGNKIYKKNYQSKIDIKISDLENKEQNLLSVEEKLNEKEEELISKEKELNDLKNKLDEKAQKLKEKKLDELDDYIDSKIDEITEIYDDFIKNKKDVKNTIKKLNEVTSKKEELESIEVGDYVYLKFLNVYGTVTKVNKDKITINSDGGMSFETDRNLLEKEEKPKTTHTERINIDDKLINNKMVSHTLNLIGYHIDEGIDALGNYLDSCIRANVKNVKIIHGFGTGKLKEAIHSYLKKNKFVKEFRLCNELEGGSGATMVTLK